MNLSASYIGMADLSRSSASFDPLLRLLEEYAAVEPHRSKGGIAAISGLQYQVWVYLAEYVGALVKRLDEPSHAKYVEGFEVLSDYLATRPEGLVCVQVKKRIDARALQNAAVEFAAIDSFLQQASPQLPALQFEVVGRSLSPDLDWSAVSLPADVVARRPELESAFVSPKASSCRLGPMSIRVGGWCL
jgi:hypothetical protein